jgi:hypothetical protein
MKIQLLTCSFAVLSGILRAQGTVFEAAPGAGGNVVVLGAVLGPAEERPPELQGITLLPLECVGRTQLNECLPDQTRRRTDVPGAARLVLAGEQGSLYKFRRPGAGSSVTFGLFRVDAAGRARLVFESSGTGSSGSRDPIPGRVAIAADGRTLLVATSEDAGGDVFEVDLDSGLVRNRTELLPPLEVERNGLVLLPGWGLALADEGVFRFERAPDAQAVEVALPTSKRWIGPDVVRSADGSTVAFLAGKDSSEAFVLACRRQGDALQVSHRAERIPGAGFLPEVATGPHLALSSDGSHAAWRVDGECFVHAVGSAGSDVHVTGSANFHYTLNDTGVIAFIDRDSLVLVVGHEDGEGIEYGDLFRLDIAASGEVAASNLSLTSGMRQPPFDYGELDTRDGLYRMPGPVPSWLLQIEHEERLLWAGADGVVVEVLAEVESLDSLAVAGDHLVAGVTRPIGVDDPREEALSLVQIPPGGQGAIVVRLPGGCHLSRQVGSRVNGRYAAVLEFPAGERLGRIDVPSPSGLLLSPSLLVFGPTAGLSADGAVLATVEVANDSAAFVWSDLGAELLRMSRVESFFLPGL